MNDTNNDTFSSTDTYLNEVSAIYELPHQKALANNKTSFEIDSLLFLLKKKLKNLKSGAVNYALELVNGFSQLKKLGLLKNSFTDRHALVMGNGPSQGFINADTLLHFQKNNGHLFAVNYWNENKNLSHIIPNFLVISDPLTLNMDNDLPKVIYQKNLALLEYISTNLDIIIICPILRMKDLPSLIETSRLIAFSDAELKGWTKNIDPRFPRGYVSMTLFKALSLAIFFGYKKIFILGMDNTYPRKIFSGPNNEILIRETHAGSNDFFNDSSNMFQTIGDYLIDCSYLFKDAHLFNRASITNLDPFSLTDAFKKLQAIEEISELLSIKRQN